YLPRANSAVRSSGECSPDDYLSTSTRSGPGRSPAPARLWRSPSDSRLRLRGVSTSPSESSTPARSESSTPLGRQLAGPHHRIAHQGGGKPVPHVLGPGYDRHRSP